MVEKLVNVNILKEKRATVELPFSISLTVPSSSLGHLKDREGNIVKDRNGRPSTFSYLAIKSEKSLCEDQRVAIAPLLWSDEIPANRVGLQVDWRGPTRVQNSGDLPLIDSVRAHRHIQSLVYLHFNITVAGEGVAEASILVGDQPHVIHPLASWKLLPHNAMKKTHNDFRRNPLTGICWLPSSRVLIGNA